MSQKRDYYSVLEVNKGASADDIKNSYRRLAKKYHPDLNKEADAEKKFKEVQEAYEVLSDDSKRQKYDTFGHDAFTNGAGGQGGFGGFDGFGEGGVDLGDIFSSIFGGGQRRRDPNASRRGKDILRQVSISFLDSVNGKTLELDINVDEKCNHCNGSGANSPSDVQTCGRCRGTGTVSVTQQSIFGTIQQQSTCPNCSGKGKVIKSKCNYCNGEGYSRKKSKVDINIPAGIANGQQIRASGKGERGINGGPNGDLYIEVMVANDSRFKREENHVHTVSKISIIDATLGCKLTVPSIYGELEVMVEEGTQHGKIYRIKGKGFKDIRSNSYGDQYVHIEVVTPTRLTREEKDLYLRLKDLQPATSDKSESTFDKFKKAFKK